jgi:hypothetical protein
MPYIKDEDQSTFFPLLHAMLRATPQEKESDARLSRRPRLPKSKAVNGGRVARPASRIRLAGDSTHHTRQARWSRRRWFWSGPRIFILSNKRLPASAAVFTCYGRLRSPSGGSRLIFHESKDNGWVQFRRNIIPHLEDGRMDGHDFMVLSMLLLLADSDSGTLKTCASALATLLHCGLDERGIQRILERLDKRDYIRRNIVAGRRGLYLVTINKYAITTGQHTGKRSELPARIDPKTA